MDKKDNIVQRMLCKVFKQDSWSEFTWAFYQWKPRRKCRDAYLWIRNRIKPFNVIKIEKLGPDWCDRDAVLFHAAFQVLVDFVEKERAFQPTWDDKGKLVPLYTPDEMRKYIEDWLGMEAIKRSITKFKEEGWDWRHSDGVCGIRQYASSMELIELYDWYKFRRDALTHEDNLVFCIYYPQIPEEQKTNIDKIIDSFDATEEPKKLTIPWCRRNREYLDKNGKPYPKIITSSEYHEIEDERMMIEQRMLRRLIEARYSMWT